MTETHLDVASTKAESAGCGCGTHSEAKTTSEPTPTAGYTTTFQVEGMTCGHCVGAVTNELTDTVPGVQTVQIDLATGKVVVVGAAPVSESAAAAAVDEAGYRLVPGSLR